MKSNPTIIISNCTIGGKDHAGNAIIKILAKGNEYLIYEIDTDDINDRLRVLIDGHDDVSEIELTRRFDAVKQSYVKAKGLLYRSSNYGMMKNRIAHTLSTCLNSNDPSYDGNTAFKTLCSDISSEQKASIQNRYFYITPVVIGITISFILCMTFLNERITAAPTWQICSGMLACSLGVGVSTFTGIKKLHFEEYPFIRFYIYFGSERLLFGYIVGAISYIAIRSGVFSPSIISHTYWANLMVFVAAGFSEQLVPSLIKKVDA